MAAVYGAAGERAVASVKHWACAGMIWTMSGVLIKHQNPGCYLKIRGIRTIPMLDAVKDAFEMLREGAEKSGWNDVEITTE